MWVLLAREVSAACIQQALVRLTTLKRLAKLANASVPCITAGERSPSPALPQPVNHIRCCHRPANVIALGVVAAKLLECFKLLNSFYTFGDDNHA